MSVPVRWSATLSTFVVLAGCVSYEAKPLDPVAELAALRGTTLDGLVVTKARPGEVESARQKAIDLADGLDEEELVAVALTLNPELRAKRLATGEADAALIQAGLWPNPDLSLAWRTGVGGASGHSTDADLLIDLLQPWRRAARTDAAKAHVDEVGAEIVAAEWRLVREVRLRWLDVRAAEQTLALLEDELALRERTKELAARRRGAGEGTELDVSTSELDVAEVRRDRRRAAGDLDAARRALNELLGLPPAFALRLSDEGKPLAVTVFADVADDELDRRLLAGRFELRALEAAYARTEHELRLAVQSQFPNLKLGLSGERDVDGDKRLGPGLDLEIPLFDRNQGEIASKANARDQARAEYVALLHRLRAAAYEARAQLHRARDEIDAQEKDVLPLVRRNAELVESAFQAREVNVLDRVTAQERTLRAREAYLDAVVRYQRSLIDLETATGTPLGKPVALPGAQQKK